MPNWTVRVEYRYYNFGNNSNQAIYWAPSRNWTLNENVVKVGLTYLFGAPARRRSWPSTDFLHYRTSTKPGGDAGLFLGFDSPVRRRAVAGNPVAGTLEFYCNLAVNT